MSLPYWHGNYVRADTWEQDDCSFDLTEWGDDFDDIVIIHT
jgi:hypothetical protein